MLQTITTCISAVRQSQWTRDPGNERFTSSRYSQYILFFHNSFYFWRYSCSKIVSKTGILGNSWSQTIRFLCITPKKLSQTAKNDAPPFVRARSRTLGAPTTSYGMQGMSGRFLVAQIFYFKKFHFFLNFLEVIRFTHRRIFVPAPAQDPYLTSTSIRKAQKKKQKKMNFFKKKNSGHQKPPRHALYAM